MLNFSNDFFSFFVLFSHSFAFSHAHEKTGEHFFSGNETYTLLWFEGMRIFSFFRCVFFVRFCWFTLKIVNWTEIDLNYFRLGWNLLTIDLGLYFCVLTNLGKHGRKCTTWYQTDRQTDKPAGKVVKSAIIIIYREKPNVTCAVKPYNHTDWDRCSEKNVITIYVCLYMRVYMRIHTNTILVAVLKVAINEKKIQGQNTLNKQQTNNNNSAHK